MVESQSDILPPVLEAGALELDTVAVKEFYGKINESLGRTALVLSEHSGDEAVALIAMYHEAPERRETASEETTKRMVDRIILSLQGQTALQIAQQESASTGKDVKPRSVNKSLRFARSVIANELDFVDSLPSQLVADEAFRPDKLEEFASYLHAINPAIAPEGLSPANVEMLLRQLRYNALFDDNLMSNVSTSIKRLKLFLVGNSFSELAAQEGIGKKTAHEALATFIPQAIARATTVREEQWSWRRYYGVGRVEGVPYLAAEKRETMSEFVGTGGWQRLSGPQRIILQQLLTSPVSSNWRSIKRQNPDMEDPREYRRNQLIAVRAFDHYLRARLGGRDVTGRVLLVDVQPGRYYDPDRYEGVYSSASSTAQIDVSSGGPSDVFVPNEPMPKSDRPSKSRYDDQLALDFVTERVRGGAHIAELARRYQMGTTTVENALKKGKSLILAHPYVFQGDLVDYASGKHRYRMTDSEVLALASQMQALQVDVPTLARLVGKPKNTVSSALVRANRIINDHPYVYAPELLDFANAKKRMYVLNDSEKLGLVQARVDGLTVAQIARQHHVSVKTINRGLKEAVKIIQANQGVFARSLLDYAANPGQFIRRGAQPSGQRSPAITRQTPSPSPSTPVVAGRPTAQIAAERRMIEAAALRIKYQLVLSQTRDQLLQRSDVLGQPELADLLVEEAQRYFADHPNEFRKEAE